MAKTAAEREDDIFCQAMRTVEAIAWDEVLSARENYRLRVKQWHAVIVAAEAAARAAAEAAREAEER